jgi:hypothetical protein
VLLAGAVASPETRRAHLVTAALLAVEVRANYRYLALLTLPTINGALVWLAGLLVFLLKSHSSWPSDSSFGYDPVMVFLDVQIERRRACVSPTAATLEVFFIVFLIVVVNLACFSFFPAAGNIPVVALGIINTVLLFI